MSETHSTPSATPEERNEQLANEFQAVAEMIEKFLAATTSEDTQPKTRLKVSRISLARENVGVVCEVALHVQLNDTPQSQPAKPTKSDLAAAKVLYIQSPQFQSSFNNWMSKRTKGL